MRSVKIGGKYYYVGLEWETLSSTENIKDKLKEYRNGYYCFRNLSGMINVSHAEELDGKYEKLPSLASAVAGAKKEPWCGYFKAEEDLYWYIAVRDNQAIISDADVIGTEEEIKKIFEDNLSLGWDVVIENGTEEDIVNLIEEKSLSYVLRVNNNLYTYIAVIAGISISLFILYHIFYKKREIKPVFVPKVFTAKKVVKVPGYKLLPKPLRVFNACKKAFISIPANYSGWKITDFKCSDNRIIYSYTKQKFANAFIAPEGKLSISGTTITGSRVLNLHKPARFRKLLSRQKLLKEIYGYMQDFGIKGQLTVMGNKFNLNLNLNNLDKLPVFFSIPSFRVTGMNFANFPDIKINVKAEVWYD